MCKYAAGCLIAAILSTASAMELKSPDGKVAATIAVENGRLGYMVMRGGAAVLGRSDMGITIDGADLGKDAVLGEPKFGAMDEKYPWYGVKAEAMNRCNTAAIGVKSGGVAWMLEARVYNSGFAYRYVVGGQGKRKITSEATNWRLPAGAQIWFQTQTVSYEGLYRKGKPVGIKQLGFPVTVELPDGTYAAITEGALFNYSGMSLTAKEEGTLQGIFEDDPNGFVIDGEIRSPWRITMTGPDLNALVNCDIVHNVCPEPDARLFPQGIKTEWIKPGRAFWHWWSGTAGDFNGVALERQKWWADKAGEAGFEYILVDAGWERSWGRDGNDKWAGLKELCDYAGKRGVRVWVWKRWAPGRTEGIEMTGLNDAETRREFFKQVSTAGAAGIKIDFMDSESKDRIDFYTNTLKDAAEHKLMINFHGANKPTGESRTFPNEMTREGVRGLEYLMDWNRGPKPADQYAILPFTRFLAGHGDFTPCTFQQKMLYGTTFTLQLATAIIYTSPVMHWADKADLYLESPLAEVVRQIPSVWDETLVLPGSRIGELAAFARRKGNDWYIGIVNGTQDRKVYDIDLSFLGDGEYRAIMVFDRMDNLPWMRMKRTSLGKSNGINAEIAAGGGFAAWLAR